MDVVLDRPAELPRGDGVTVRRHRKPTFARTAPVDLRHETTAQCEVVIEALADQGPCTSCSVHDIADLERRGVVGLFLAGAAFADAARVQGAAAGSAAPSVLVPHPVQDDTDAELRAVA